MPKDELIAALEKATGPDRELNKLLAPFVGLRLVEEGHPLGPCCYDQNGHGVPLPNFTASIDAALTLVPEGMRCRFLIYENGRAGAQLWWPPEDLPDAWGKAYATPALAICIAALRATERGEAGR